jgi:transposase
VLLQKGRTSHGQYYTKLLAKLIRRIRRKRLKFKEEVNFIFSRKRAPPISKFSTEARNRLISIKLYRPPYSPILVPSNHYIFSKLKKHLAMNTFCSDEEAQNQAKKDL